MSQPSNLFADLPRQLPQELNQVLLENASVRIERIISHGHASPEGFWYDQAEHEWVLLVQGAARLTLDGTAPITLAAGDFINIPAHRKHRVDWTDPQQATIWLAVFHR